MLGNILKNFGVGHVPCQLAQRHENANGFQAIAKSGWQNCLDAGQSPQVAERGGRALPFSADDKGFVPILTSSSESLLLSKSELFDSSPVFSG